jgi:hypothetical protein
MTEKYLETLDVARRLGMSVDELAKSGLKPAAKIGETEIFRSSDVAGFEEARDVAAVSGGLYMSRAEAKITLGVTGEELDAMAKQRALVPADQRAGVPVYTRAAVLAMKARREGKTGEAPKAAQYVSEAEAARSLGLPLAEFRTQVANRQLLRPSHTDPLTGVSLFPAGIVAALAEKRTGGGNPAPRGPVKVELVGEVEASQLSGLPVSTLKSMVAAGRLRPYATAPDGSMTFSAPLMREITKSAYA